MSGSTSTEKLEVMENIIQKINCSLSKSKIGDMSSLHIGWEKIETDEETLVCPTLHIEF